MRSPVAWYLLFMIRYRSAFLVEGDGALLMIVYFDNQELDPHYMISLGEMELSQDSNSLCQYSTT